jgi:hypothetical protein
MINATWRLGRMMMRDVHCWHEKKIKEDDERIASNKKKKKQPTSSL